MEDAGAVSALQVGRAAWSLHLIKKACFGEQLLNYMDQLLQHFSLSPSSVFPLWPFLVDE